WLHHGWTLRRRRALPMADYDISRLPESVQNALMHLTAKLVQTWSTSEAPQARCQHGTPETPRCASCVVIESAEVVIGNAQDELRHIFPRNALELQVLEILKHLRPLGVSAQQISHVLGVERALVKRVCTGLWMVGTVDRPSNGLYRYRP